MAKKILITGADGFIGSHLTELLVREGHDVRAFVFYNSFNSWGWLDHAPDDIRKDLDVFAGDIRDPNGVRAAMKDCDIVLHLAAESHVDRSIDGPADFIDTNITGTFNMLEAARKYWQAAGRPA